MQPINILFWSLLSRQGLAIELDVNDKDSIKNAANIATYGMMKYYTGNETGGIPGAFPEKWWEGSALLLGLLNYWHFTGDDYYNEELSIALEWQSGDQNYMPSNYSQWLGNDDQMFWGLSAMTAAEWKLPDRDPYSWLSLAQGVFNTQRDRWDTSSCGGGLHWQIWSYEKGYDLKNSVSNGGFFQLAARIYRYTNDTNYLDWAKKSYEWSTTVNLVNETDWTVADSVSDTNECANTGTSQWSYNYGIYMAGCAYLYSMTLDDHWLECTRGLMDTLFSLFFTKENNYIISDYTCETQKPENCDNDQVLFKGLVHSWLADTALLIPSLFDEILAKLQSSAMGAARSCTGQNNNTCGIRWTLEEWDGQSGMEEEISASNAFSVLMLKWMNGTNSSSPVTSTTGGNSTSNVNASVNTNDDLVDYRPIKTADKVGAGIVAALFIGGTIGAAVFLFMGD